MGFNLFIAFLGNLKTLSRYYTMSGSINKVILVGNVGRDPEIRTTQDGKEIATFSLATTDSWRDKNTGERKDKTEWHRIVIFSDGLVNVVKNYVKKGMRLYVEGSVSTRKWMDSNNQEKFTTEIVLQGFQSSLVMLDRNTNTASGVQNAEQPKNSAATPTNQPAEEKAFEGFNLEELADEIPPF